MFLTIAIISAVALTLGMKLYAYTSNEQVTSHGTLSSSGLRCFATHIHPKTFASGSGTLAPLTPVGYNSSTNKWIVWSATTVAGFDGTISAFVWPNPVTLSGSGEVLGNVVTAGQIHFGDIVLPDGETLSNLKAACRTGLRQLGIDLQGLENVR